MTATSLLKGTILNLSVPDLISKQRVTIMWDLDVSLLCVTVQTWLKKSCFSPVCQLCFHLPQLSADNTEHCFYGYRISAFVFSI